MRTTTIGSLEVSVIGLGCNNFGRALDAEQSRQVVDAALDAGVNFFDTAANYGSGRSEGFLGAAIRGRRDGVVIATKFGMARPDEAHGGASPAYVKQSTERSLGELGVEVIDLLQLHFPDPDTPIAETLGAMWELVDGGLVREIGCSNLDAEQLAEALSVSGEAGRPFFVSDQVEYSLIHRDPEQNGLADLCSREGVALLPYYPLANGLLTGKHRRDAEPTGRLKMERYQGFLTDRNFDVAEAVVKHAEARGVAPVQLALAWLLSRPAVPAVTPGATTPAQVVANAATADIAWTEGDWSEFHGALPA